MPHEILLREQYGTLGREIIYVKTPDDGKVVRLDSDRVRYSFYQDFKDFLWQVFLPQGYPDSVSEDYLSYQLWDTVQAFCSTITGTLTTHAVMKGVGVGDSTATPMAAAVTWIVKDGTGMVARIAFAWWKGTFLDMDCKKWRLVADVINDAAMFLEMLLPMCTDLSVTILCGSTAMKAIVGVAGGATRAAITQHQAVRHNMADVSAKDGSQETMVNLCASMIGILILTTFDESKWAWELFVFFAALHLYTNYRAVKCLRLTTLNSARLSLVFQAYLKTAEPSSPEVVNRQESVIIGGGITEKQLCGFKISMGSSLEKMTKSKFVTSNHIALLVNLYQNRKYLIIVDMKAKKIHVCLKTGETPVDVIKAYFHAVLVGIAASILYNLPLSILTNTPGVSITSSLHRLRTSLLKFGAANEEKSTRLPLQALLCTDQFVAEEFDQFLRQMHSKGWKTHCHNLPLDEWRAEWPGGECVKDEVIRTDYK